MPNYASEINKEFYKMQIEAIANTLLAKADDILEDWDKGISEINISANISAGPNQKLSVQKKYKII